MKLSDFATLANAQAHPVTSYKKISVGEASQYFGLSGMLDNLEAESASMTVIDLGAMSTTVGALCRTILNSAKTSGFASDPTTDDGANNRGAAQLLLGAGVFTNQSIVDGFWAKGTVVTKPYEFSTQSDFDEAKDAGETITLPSVMGQHSIKVNTTIQPRKPTTLIIEHRFGTDAGNLTGWHKLGSVINIYYPTALRGAYYESGQLPATKAAYRELRLVSPLTLGVGLYSPVVTGSI